MITEDMTPTEKLKELYVDSYWFANISSGWNKKYAKQLRQYQKSRKQVIDKHVYKTPNDNTVLVYFIKEKLEEGRKIYNTLLFYYIWELNRKDGRKDFLIVNAFNERGEYVICKDFMQISAHANDRMKQRSGKDFLEIYESMICDYGMGAIWVEKYTYNNNPNEICGRFGNGLLFGEIIESKCKFIKTYIDWQDEHSNQNMIHLKTKRLAETQGESTANKYDTFVLRQPKRQRKASGYVRVR